MVRAHALKRACGLFLLCAVTGTASRAQTFTTLLSFEGFDGTSPNGELVQGFDGNFYGTTNGGGARNLSSGTVFKINRLGKLTRLYSFCTGNSCPDGKYPDTGLLLATNGKLYGVTSDGADLCGTVFEITTAGTLTTLHIFHGTNDGCDPAGLIQAADGNFYGTTVSGGANGGGTVFKMTATGTLNTLYSFCSLSNCADGMGPDSPLVQGTDGKFYGTTAFGGIGSHCDFSLVGPCGTVFKITATGKLTTLYSFCSLIECADGNFPNSSLIQATDGNFYGTTFYGGASANCPVHGCGIVFEITAEGTLTTLYSFCFLPNCADGIDPHSLIQATDGNFYGTTRAGGANDIKCYMGCGTLFEVTAAGTLTTLYTLCSMPNCADGIGPSGLLEATDGVFYGTTGEGGAGFDDGTVFSLANGLCPFVSFVGNPGKVGQKFAILGQGLTGTTSVSLNGINVVFTVKSDTLLAATVPVGATNGYMVVSTSSGTLMSNVPFRVIP